MGGLSGKQVNILCISIESVVYATYTVAFVVCICILSRRKNLSPVNSRLLMMMMILYLLTTTLYVIDAFVAGKFFLSTAYYEDTAYALRQHNIHNLLYCIYDGIFGINILLADTLVVWRCFILWNRQRRVIIVPIILLIAEIAFGITSIAVHVELYLIILDTPWREDLPPRYDQLGRLLRLVNMVYYITTFGTNVCMTGLVSFRIWWTARQFQKTSGRIYSGASRVAHIFLESGAAYAVFLLLSMVFSGNTVASIASVFLAMSTGLVPTLVIVLVALGKTTEYTTRSIDSYALDTAVQVGGFENSTVGRDMEETQIRSPRVQVIDTSESNGLKSPREAPVYEHADAGHLMSNSGGMEGVDGSR